MEAAQRALQAAERRRKLAVKITGGGDGADKRERPMPTPSTKVTPEGKKPCNDFEGEVAPRALSFSDGDAGHRTGDFCESNRLAKKTMFCRGVRFPCFFVVFGGQKGHPEKNGPQIVCHVLAPL